MTSANDWTYAGQHLFDGWVDNLEPKLLLLIPILFGFWSRDTVWRKALNSYLQDKKHTIDWINYFPNSERPWTHTIVTFCAIYFLIQGQSEENH